MDMISRLLFLRKVSQESALNSPKIITSNPPPFTIPTMRKTPMERCPSRPPR